MIALEIRTSFCAVTFPGCDGGRMMLFEERCAVGGADGRLPLHEEGLVRGVSEKETRLVEVIVIAAKGSKCASVRQWRNEE